MTRPMRILAFCTLLLAAIPARAADSLLGLYAVGRVGLGYDVAVSKPGTPGATGWGGGIQGSGSILDPGATSLAVGWGYSGLNFQLDLQNLVSPGGAPTLGTLEIGYRLKTSFGRLEPWLRAGVGYSFTIDRDKASYFGATNPAGVAGTVEGGLDFFLVKDLVAVGPAVIGQVHFQTSPAVILFAGVVTVNFKLVL